MYDADDFSSYAASVNKHYETFQGFCFFSAPCGMQTLTNTIDKQTSSWSNCSTGEADTWKSCRGVPSVQYFEAGHSNEDVPEISIVNAVSSKLEKRQKPKSSESLTDSHSLPHPTRSIFSLIFFPTRPFGCVGTYKLRLRRNRKSIWQSTLIEDCSNTTACHLESNPLLEHFNE